MGLTVRRATPADVDAIRAFWSAMDAADPSSNCWEPGRIPSETLLRHWFRDPRAIAVAEDQSGLAGIDLFEMDSGLTWLTAVTPERLGEVIPLIMRQEMAWTGFVPWGPAPESASLRKLYVAAGFEEGSGYLHWVGP